jgi:hypothetical protein
LSVPVRLPEACRFIRQAIGVEIPSLQAGVGECARFQQVQYAAGCRPNLVHFTGWVGNRTGAVPDAAGVIPAPTLDVLIGDAIGGGTCFRPLEVASTGNPKDSYSARNTGSINASEPSPIAFYTRIFGPDFVDPGKADFKLDPHIVARQSVLSAVREDSQDFVRALGSADRWFLPVPIRISPRFTRSTACRS